MSVGMGKAFADLCLAAKWQIGTATLVTSTGLIAVPGAPFYMMKHNGDPGPTGLANTIDSAKRAKVSGANSGQMASSGALTGQVESTGDTVWTSATDNKTVTNITVWGGTGAATNPNGVLIHSGPCIGSYSIGDNPTIFAGDFTDAGVIVA